MDVGPCRKSKLLTANPDHVTVALKCVSSTCTTVQAAVGVGLAIAAIKAAICNS
jgi:hypothetical protein